MYLGRIVEVADADTLYENPKHPYTAALLSAVPKGHGDGKVAQRIVLQGDVPSPVDLPPGCPFHPRCPKARIVSGKRTRFRRTAARRCRRSVRSSATNGLPAGIRSSMTTSCSKPRTPNVFRHSSS